MARMPQGSRLCHRKSVRDKQIGDIASSVFRKIARGERPSLVEMNGLDTAKEVSATEKAMEGETPSTASARPQSGGRRAAFPEKAKQPQGVYARPSHNAVMHLLKNPATAKAFDGIYGTGEAANWLPKE